MALTNAQRQAAYRQRRAEQEPILRYRKQVGRRTRPQRWADAVAELRTLQAEYQDWLDSLPEALQDTAVAEKLAEVCSLDLDALDVELPKGFGRD